jgi:phage replication-related protein YjqB (UPF0714/DUF867 family)
MNVADRYRSFTALDAEQRRGIDYNIRLQDRGTAIAVIAPHGGGIEPGSSEIAMAIARDDYSFYAFEVASGFQAASSDRALAGRQLANICNRGTAGAGVQIEIPRTLRDKLKRDQAILTLFSDAVRQAMSSR